MANFIYNQVIKELRAMQRSKEVLFMDVARLFAYHSTCARGQVGAVIVRDRRIVATGYNGSSPGEPHCTDVGCIVGPDTSIPCPGCDKGFTAGGEAHFACGGSGSLKISTGCQRAVHAEANAIAWAARAGTPTGGTTLFCTHGPCLACAKLIAAAGIELVVYETPYRNPEGLQLLDSLNIVARQPDCVI